MQLWQSDVAWLCKVTGLNKSKLLSLVEEPHDLNLLLESICDKLPKEKIVFLSFPLYARLVLLNNTRNRQYDLNEKSYISDAVSIRFPVVFHDIKSADYESKSCYYLVLMGLFKDAFNRYRPWNPLPSPEVCRNLVSRGFAKSGKPVLASHVPEWIDILQFINKQHFLGKKLMDEC